MAKTPGDLLPTERAARLAWDFAQGRSYTVCEVAVLLSMTRRGAGLLLEKIARVIPLVEDNQGIWYAMK